MAEFVEEWRSHSMLVIRVTVFVPGGLCVAASTSNVLLFIIIITTVTIITSPACTATVCHSPITTHPDNVYSRVRWFPVFYIYYYYCYFISAVTMDGYYGMDKSLLEKYT